MEVATVAAGGVGGSRVVRFRIHGDYLTHCARNLMLSEEPVKACRLLVEGLGGESAGEVEKAAISVLDGKSKFVGVDDLELEGDTSPEGAEYLTEIRYIYAGRVRVDGRWWRPLSRVTSFGPEDMRGGNIGKCTSQHAPTAREIRKARVEYYAGATNRAFEVVADAQTHSTACGEPRCGKCALRGLDCLIFEPVAAPPAWWPVNADPETAVHDFLAVGRELEEDGHALRFNTGWALARTTHVERRDNDDAVRQRVCDRAAEERADRVREVALVARCAQIREQVLAQAAGDTFVLTPEEGPALVVPRAPFVCWALGRTSLWKLAPKWTPVSESGLKMAEDNTYHTDWTIGAGLDVRTVYGGNKTDIALHKSLMQAVDEEVTKIQQELGRFTCAVLVDAGPVSGKIGEEIIVLPNLDPIHLEKLSRAQGIITQAGGKLAHLAQVALERGVTIMLVSDAVDRFTDGQSVTLGPAEGRIESHVQRY